MFIVEQVWLTVIPGLRGVTVLKHQAERELHTARADIFVDWTLSRIRGAFGHIQWGGGGGRGGGGARGDFSGCSSYINR